MSTDEKNAKLGQKGSRGGPLISRGCMKLETSNLAQRWMAVNANEKMQNWVKRGHLGVTRPILGILGPP